MTDRIERWLVGELKRRRHRRIYMLLRARLEAIAYSGPYGERP